jgi:glycosyltransferase involved in cell wall biosynthesis
MADELPLVSCLCVTRNRVDMLRRAISCFLSQTYPNRELLIVYEEDDSETRDFVAQLNGPMIRAIEVETSPKLSLGALRNISVESSRGYYVAQWDDDDWYAPTRLSEQIETIHQSKRHGCVLARWLMYDALSNKTYLSASRCWEGSLVAQRSAVPKYPELAKGEDTVVIEKMIADGKLAALDSPQIYVYTVHGTNTWDRAHWESNLRPYAKLLSEEEHFVIKSALEKWRFQCE